MTVNVIDRQPVSNINGIKSETHSSKQFSFAVRRHATRKFAELRLNDAQCSRMSTPRYTAVASPTQHLPQTCPNWAKRSFGDRWHVRHDGLFHRNTGYVRLGAPSCTERRKRHGLNHAENKIRFRLLQHVCVHTGDFGNGFGLLLCNGADWR